MHFTKKKFLPLLWVFYYCDWETCSCRLIIWSKIQLFAFIKHTNKSTAILMFRLVRIWWKPLNLLLLLTDLMLTLCVFGGYTTTQHSSCVHRHHIISIRGLTQTDNPVSLKRLKSNTCKAACCVMQKANYSDIYCAGDLIISPPLPFIAACGCNVVFYCS